MCILASREHTCIHSEVSESKNKTEDCRKSVEGREVCQCYCALFDKHKGVVFDGETFVSFILHCYNLTSRYCLLQGPGEDWQALCRSIPSE